MTLAWPLLTKLLALIQSRLDGDLSLEALAKQADISPWQLQRGFKAALGESPKAYVERLRIERGAFRMLVQDASLLEISLDCGFQTPETFARAFRRRHGQSPHAWRRERWAVLAGAGAQESMQGSALEPPDFRLSETRLVRLQSLHLASVRHLGPYEAVPESLFDTLAAWADCRRLPGQRHWLGIGHDAPGITAMTDLRFDAALIVDGPFDSDGPVVHRVLPGGSFALTTHVGSYATLPMAYAEILPRLLGDRRWTVIGLPAVEFYHCPQVCVRAALNHTDICLPVALANDTDPTRQGAASDRP